MTHPDSAGPLVLVAEDDAVLRLLVVESLRSAGIPVAEAVDGAAAMEAFDRLKPQLVLLDVDMPKANGYTVCRFIREHRAGEHVGIAMMTGLDDTRSIEEAFNAGATDFITKPFPLPLLVHRVRYLLRSNDGLVRLERSLQELAAAQRFVKISSWSIDLESGVLTGSEELHRLLGLPEGESEEGDHRERLRALLHCIHPDDRRRVRETIETAMDEGTRFQVEYRVDLGGGGQRHIYTEGRVALREGKPWRLDAVSQDVSGRRALEARVMHLEDHDPVTGLGNRARLSRHLSRLIESAPTGAVIMAGVRNLSRINQTHGHEAGDALLLEVARRLTETVRLGDFVSRFRAPGIPEVGRVGGGEFAVVLTGSGDPRHLAGIAERILDALGVSYRLREEQVDVRFRLGLASWPGDASEPARVLQAAEAALRSVEVDDRKAYAFHREEMGLRAAELAVMERDLRLATERGQLELFYQPKIALADGAIEGVEALLRWRRGEAGFVSPADFIPLAEETGIIHNIGRWVIEEALAQHRVWRDEGVGTIPVAINLSTKQIDDGTILDGIRARCEDLAIETRFVELEVTESCIIGDAAKATAFLERARKLGLRISLDDFGTGYSSLSYLKKLPLDTLKIDRAFVSGIDQSDGEPELTTAIVAIGTMLGMRVVAEGVETEEQWALLREWGCHAAQGFLMSRPLPAPEAAEFLRLGRWEPK